MVVEHAAQTTNDDINDDDINKMELTSGGDNAKGYSSFYHLVRRHVSIWYSVLCTLRRQVVDWCYCQKWSGRQDNKEDRERDDVELYSFNPEQNDWDEVGCLEFESYRWTHACIFS